MIDIFEFGDKPLLNKSTQTAQSIVGSSSLRADHDFYPTPPEATVALLERENFDGSVWEPACGDGAICDVLEKYNISFFATDLIDRGYGEGNHDFLLSEKTANHIITNPPYTLAKEFVEHALQQTDGKVAMLCKLAFLEGKKRKNMFQNTPLARVYVFSERVTFSRNGIVAKKKTSGMIAFAWFVWDHSHKGQPTIDWV